MLTAYVPKSTILLQKKAKNATYAKDVLEAVSIKAETDTRNLVEISKLLHKFIHTDMYYGWSNSVVISAYNAAKGNKDLQLSNVEHALETIRKFLTDLDKYINNLRP